MARTDRTAGSGVSQTDCGGPRIPRKTTTPTTATAAKLTELFNNRKATERRAMVSVFIPARESTHAPSAIPPAPDAGMIEPVPTSERPTSAAERQRMIEQKTGRNINT